MTPDLLFAALQGFVVGGGLILAIGAQNALVLRQGLLRQHHLSVASIGAVFDALLIVAGIAGMGALIAAAPGLLTVILWAGAAFLAWQGVKATRSALRPGGLEAARAEAADKRAALRTMLAVTVLNPHVYLDTTVMLGGVGARLPGAEAIAFGAGAVTASFVWFYGLALAAAALAPWLARPATWRIIDVLVAVVMFMVAGVLVMEALSGDK